MMRAMFCVEKGRRRMGSLEQEAKSKRGAIEREAGLGSGREWSKSVEVK